MIEAPPSAAVIVCNVRILCAIEDIAVITQQYIV